MPVRLWSVEKWFLGVLRTFSSANDNGFIDIVINSCCSI